MARPLAEIDTNVHASSDEYCEHGLRPAREHVNPCQLQPEPARRGRKSSGIWTPHIGSRKRSRLSGPAPEAPAGVADRSQPQGHHLQHSGQGGVLKDAGDGADSDVEEISSQEFRESVFGPARPEREAVTAGGPANGGGGGGAAAAAGAMGGLGLLAAPAAAVGSAPGAAAAGGGGEEDDDVLIMASKGQVPTRDLPHPRPHCCNQRYRESQFGADVANVAHCPQCFCYVCDVRASECAFWGTGILGSDHANAHPDNTYWARLRMRARVVKPPAARQRLLTAASTSAVAPVRAALARWEQTAAVAALAKAEAEEAAGGAGVEAFVVAGARAGAVVVATACAAGATSVPAPAGGAAGPAGASSSSVVGVRVPAAPPQRGAAAAAAGPALGAAAASAVTQQVALQRRAAAQHEQRLPLLPPLPHHHSQQQLHNQQQQPQQDPAKALIMQQGLAQLPPQDRHTMQLQVQAQLIALQQQQQQQHLPAALGHKTEEMLALWHKGLSRLSSQQHGLMLSHRMSSMAAESLLPLVSVLQSKLGKYLAQPREPAPQHPRQQPPQPAAATSHAPAPVLQQQQPATPGPMPLVPAAPPSSRLPGAGAVAAAALGAAKAIPHAGAQQQGGQPHLPPPQQQPHQNHQQQDPAAQLLQQELERAPPQHRDEWQQELLAQWMAPQQPQLAAGVQREDVLAAARQCLSHLTAQQHKAMLHDAMSQLPAEQRQPKLEELRGLVGARLAHTVHAVAEHP